jgi:hypothetical protein
MTTTDQFADLAGTLTVGGKKPIGRDPSAS